MSDEIKKDELKEEVKPVEKTENEEVVDIKVFNKKIQELTEFKEKVEKEKLENEEKQKQKELEKLPEIEKQKEIEKAKLKEEGAKEYLINRYSKNKDFLEFANIDDIEELQEKSLKKLEKLIEQFESKKAEEKAVKTSANTGQPLSHVKANPKEPTKEEILKYFS